MTTIILYPLLQVKAEKMEEVLETFSRASRGMEGHTYLSDHTGVGCLSVRLTVGYPL